MKMLSPLYQVNGEGIDFEPKLSEIGSKLPKEGQYLAILYHDNQWFNGRNDKG